MTLSLELVVRFGCSGFAGVAGVVTVERDTQTVVPPPLLLLCAGVSDTNPPDADAGDSPSDVVDPANSSGGAGAGAGAGASVDVSDVVLDAGASTVADDVPAGTDDVVATLVADKRKRVAACKTAVTAKLRRLTDAKAVLERRIAETTSTLETTQAELGLTREALEAEEEALAEAKAAASAKMRDRDAHGAKYVAQAEAMGMDGAAERLVSLRKDPTQSVRGAVLTEYVALHKDWVKLSDKVEALEARVRELQHKVVVLEQRVHELTSQLEGERNALRDNAASITEAEKELEAVQTSETSLQAEEARLQIGRAHV